MKFQSLAILVFALCLSVELDKTLLKRLSGIVMRPETSETGMARIHQRIFAHCRHIQMIKLVVHEKN